MLPCPGVMRNEEAAAQDRVPRIGDGLPEEKPADLFLLFMDQPASYATSVLIY